MTTARRSLLMGASAQAHPADQSEMQVKPSPHELQVRFTFNLLTVTKCVRVDADGDQKLSVEELKAAEPVFTKYLNEHIRLELNQKSATWGENAAFSYLWPNFAKTPPMPEIEQAALPPRAPVDVQVKVVPAENGTTKVTGRPGVMRRRPKRIQSSSSS